MADHQLGLASPPDAYQQRRARLAKTLRRPLVLFAGHAPARNYPTNPYPFRANSSYLYFGGPPLEHAALLIEPSSNGIEGCSWFRPGLEPDDVLWFGEIADDAACLHAAGLPNGALQDRGQLESAVKGRDVGAIIPAAPATIEQASALNVSPANPEELRQIIELRLIKDEHELAALRCAAGVGMDAHRAALAAVQPGAREVDVVAAFEAVLAANFCTHAFNPIMTIRGEVLHNHAYRNELKAGDLLLMDAGAELAGGYASDMTRTVPVSGSWTDIQKQLYKTVLRALREGVAKSLPGARFRDVHDHAARILCEGLVQAELLRGDPAELAGRFAHTLFFPHGLGHLIGLEVHDMEDFGDLAGYAEGRTRRTEFGNNALRLDRDLAVGMTVTVEPGIYLVPAVWKRDDLVGPFRDCVNQSKVDALLQDGFGGIRIEHTIAVREADATGPEILTRDLPSDPTEILSLTGASRAR